MQQSQDEAKDVALTRLGYTVQADPAEITVVEVCRGAPAYGKVQPGDRVLAVDGQPITDVARSRRSCSRTGPATTSTSPSTATAPPAGHASSPAGVGGPALVRAGEAGHHRDRLPGGRARSRSSPTTSRST